MTQEIITITVEAGQMTARRKYRKIAQRRPVPVWAIVKYAALTIAGIMLFREGAARALAYRGYFAVGGEVFALFLPVFYYCLSRTVRDLNSTGRYVQQAVKHVLVVNPKKFAPGKLAPASSAEASGEYPVTYYATYIDGKKVLEIDILNFIYYVNGVDYLEVVRKALGK